MPYDYEVVHLIKDDVEIIWDLEKLLHRLYSNYKYSPLISFPGSIKECFKI